MKRSSLDPDPETYKVDNPEASNYLFNTVSNIYNKITNTYDVTKEVGYAISDRISETLFEPYRV